MVTIAGHGQLGTFTFDDGIMMEGLPVMCLAWHDDWHDIEELPHCYPCHSILVEACQGEKGSPRQQDLHRVHDRPCMHHETLDLCSVEDNIHK